MEEVSESAQQPRPARTRRRIAWAAGAGALLLGASLVFACAGIIGIDDRLPDDAVPDASAADDRAAGDDRPALPSTCAQAERCVQVPEGWQLAELDPSDRPPSCAPGFGSPQEVVVANNGLGCVCRCTETSPGSCAAAGATTTFRDYPAAGCGASTATYTLTVLDGGCGSLAIPTTPYVRVPTPAAGSPSCAADAGPTKLAAGRACLSQGASCNDGGTCAGALLDSELLCVVKAGDVACPAGFGKKIPAGASAAEDTRLCGTCTCTPGTTCENARLDVFSGAGCTAATTSIPASGSCTPTDAGVSYTSYRYAGKAPGCQASVPALLDGGVTIADKRTFCCEPRN